MKSDIQSRESPTKNVRIDKGNREALQPIDFMYREGESNPHSVATTGFWVRRVYQFRHLGKEVGLV